jgi:molybdopterin converting factor small subunit
VVRLEGVKVALASIYREAARAKELTLDLPEGSTLGDLASKLSGLYGGSFKELMAEEGSISREALLLVDGMNIRQASLKLKDGDFIFIASEVVGGA